ncbi:MAG: hypothetical protein JNL01_07580 [Bdellovibrionales bacterium]|nr:hypothetical protein [Bdellovibrionales bacterium]
MNSATSIVGKDTLAFCSSCRMDLNHTIVAMQGDQIKRVQCRTCRKEHVYRSPKGVNDPKMAPPPRKTASGASTPRSTPVEVEWARKMAEAKAMTAKVYSAKSSFQLGEKLKHPSFGEGIVSKLMHPNKIEVLFEMDLKVLIHGGPPAS